MKPVTQIQGRTVVLANRDIDTDQIIAARFLTTTSRSGLGKHAFHDLRYNKDGSEKPDFVLNQAAAEGCSVLVGGNNFGCGSSREHAPWALLRLRLRSCDFNRDCGHISQQLVEKRFTRHCGRY